ncbi:hypothetical protein EW146_g6694 [Bondarzewia mesenterica]|uniref:Zn(2)-C6 fungal-type domain-containing protein n=1 Tax=Bondarzewia mesenterica TaxID=1095465 RepID=A0A4S4LMV7_9AGAM|nr:hypothetical protein EW146_g6694 [Bondarzewia mesenterica]
MSPSLYPPLSGKAVAMALIIRQRVGTEPKKDDRRRWLEWFDHLENVLDELRAAKAREGLVVWPSDEAREEEQWAEERSTREYGEDMRKTKNNPPCDHCEKKQIVCKKLERSKGRCQECARRRTGCSLVSPHLKGNKRKADETSQAKDKNVPQQSGHTAIVPPKPKHTRPIKTMTESLSGVEIVDDEGVARAGVEQGMEVTEDSTVENGKDRALEDDDLRLSQAHICLDDATKRLKDSYAAVIKARQSLHVALQQLQSAQGIVNRLRNERTARYIVQPHQNY